jgi:hypothetical protein
VFAAAERQHGEGESADQRHQQPDKSGPDVFHETTPWRAEVKIDLVIRNDVLTVEVLPPNRGRSDEKCEASGVLVEKQRDETPLVQAVVAMWPGSVSCCIFNFYLADNI